jgi:kynurenine formamidase
MSLTDRHQRRRPMKRFIDLSIGIEHDLPSDPPMMIPKIDYIDHSMGASQMLDFFPGIRKDQLPQSLGWALEFITLTTHSGTHLDAPYHYHPTMDRGKPSITIDEVPLEWCFSNGVLLDFRHKGDGERITVMDVKKELEMGPSSALPVQGIQRDGQPEGYLGSTLRGN